MRLTYPAPARFDLPALHAHLADVGVPGFTGVSVQGDDIHIEFPSRDALEGEEVASVDAAVSAYVFAPTWAAVRLLRAPLLLEADWRVARAEDNAEDATALRAYRQALRDITEGPDPENPTWPERPWL